MEDHFLTVVSQTEFSAAFDKYAASYPRLEEWKIGIDWLLARDPIAGQRVRSDPNYYALRTPETGTLPSILIAYRYAPDKEPHKIFLEAIYIDEES